MKYKIAILSVIYCFTSFYLPALEIELNPKKFHEISPGPLARIKTALKKPEKQALSGEVRDDGVVLIVKEENDPEAAAEALSMILQASPRGHDKVQQLAELVLTYIENLNPDLDVEVRELHMSALAVLLNIRFEAFQDNEDLFDIVIANNMLQTIEENEHRVYESYGDVFFEANEDQWNWSQLSNDLQINDDWTLENYAYTDKGWVPSEEENHGTSAPSGSDKIDNGDENTSLNPDEETTIHIDLEPEVIEKSDLSQHLEAIDSSSPQISDRELARSQDKRDQLSTSAEELLATFLQSLSEEDYSFSDSTLKNLSIEKSEGDKPTYKFSSKLDDQTLEAISQEIEHFSDSDWAQAEKRKQIFRTTSQAVSNLQKVKRIEEELAQKARDTAAAKKKQAIATMNKLLKDDSVDPWLNQWRKDQSFGSEEGLAKKIFTYLHHVYGSVLKGIQAADNNTLADLKVSDTIPAWQFWKYSRWKLDDKDFNSSNLKAITDAYHKLYGSEASSQEVNQKLEEAQNIYDSVEKLQETINRAVGILELNDKMEAFISSPPEYYKNVVKAMAEAKKEKSTLDEAIIQAKKAFDESWVQKRKNIENKWIQKEKNLDEDWLNRDEGDDAGSLARREADEKMEQEWEILREETVTQADSASKQKIYPYIVKGALKHADKILGTYVDYLVNIEGIELKNIDPASAESIKAYDKIKRKVSAFGHPDKSNIKLTFSQSDIKTLKSFAPEILMQHVENQGKNKATISANEAYQNFLLPFEVIKFLGSQEIEFEK